MDELKKPSDIQGGTLKERYHIPEGYNNLLQKIEKARELLKKSENSELKLSLPGDRGDTSLDPVDYRRSKATATAANVPLRGVAHSRWSCLIDFL